MQTLVVIGNVYHHDNSVCIYNLIRLICSGIILQIFVCFRCYATHRIPVSYPTINNSSKLSKHEHSNYVHGVFGQSFEIKACPGSILVMKSPNVSQDGIVGGSISFECEAEIAPRTTFNKDQDKMSSLQYQWLVFE